MQIYRSAVNTKQFFSTFLIPFSQVKTTTPAEGKAAVSSLRKQGGATTVVLKQKTP